MLKIKSKKLSTFVWESSFGLLYLSISWYCIVIVWIVTVYYRSLRNRITLARMLWNEVKYLFKIFFMFLFELLLNFIKFLNNIICLLKKNIFVVFNFVNKKYKIQVVKKNLNLNLMTNKTINQKKFYNLDYINEDFYLVDNKNIIFVAVGITYDTEENIFLTDGGLDPNKKLYIKKGKLYIKELKTIKDVNDLIEDLNGRKFVEEYNEKLKINTEIKEILDKYIISKINEETGYSEFIKLSGWIVTKEDFDKFIDILKKTI